MIGDIEVKGGKDGGIEKKQRVDDGLRMTVIEMDLTWRVCRGP